MRAQLVRVCLLVLVLLSAALASAQAGYPQPEDNYVNDYADLVSADVEAYLREQLASAEADHGVEISVVTIRSINDYTTNASTFERFATGLFNTWGIGDAARANGVLLLVAADDRKVRVELGAGYDTAANADAQDILDENILPAFRRGDYEGGIVNGVRGLINEFTGVLPPLPADLTVGTQATAQTPPFANPQTILTGIAVLLALVILIPRFIRWINNFSADAPPPAPYNLNALTDEDQLRADYERDPQAWEAQHQTDDGGGLLGWLGGAASSDGDDDRSSSSSWGSSHSSGSSSSSSSRGRFGGGSSKGGGASGSW